MQFGFGAGVMWGIRTDVAGTPRRFGVLQDVQFSFSGDIKELFGQYQFPVDVARGKTKIEGKAKMAQISGLIMNDLFFGDTQTVGADKSALAELGTVPGVSTYTIAVTNSGTTFVEDLGVHYHNTGLPLVNSGTTAPGAAGTYEASATGIYTFNSADASVVMDLDYLYSQAAGVSIALANNLMGFAPRFKTVFSQTYEGKVWTLQLNQCVAPKLTSPTKLDDYVVQEFDFQAYADASNTIGTLTVTDVG